MRTVTLGAPGRSARQVGSLGLGAMLFGTHVDEATSFDILDRFVEAGGTLIDTSNNYAFWLTGSRGGESEALLGRWRRSRGVGDEIVTASKVGAQPLDPALAFDGGVDGLGRDAVRASVERSLEAMTIDRLEILYAHLEDRTTPLEAQVETFAELVAEGRVGRIGLSNHWVWRVERARAHARAADLPGCEVLQYELSYLRPRTDQPFVLSPEGQAGSADGALLSYLRDQRDLTLVAYSPLLKGAYARHERLDSRYDHPGTLQRLKVLDDVVTETGATRNQVVLAWLLGGDLRIIPLVGASTVAQLEESLAGVDLELTIDQRARLDAAS